MMRSRNTSNRTVTLCVAWIMLIMIEPKSMVSVAKIGDMSVIRVLLLAGLVLLYLFRHQYRIGRNTILFAVISVGSIIFSIAINGDTSNYSYFLLIVVISSVLISELLSFEEFRMAYVTATVLLCLYSLVATYLFQNIPAFSNGFLPPFAHQNGGTAINYIFCFTFTMEYGKTFRNFGLFNEPGVYLFYITVAGVLLLSDNIETSNPKWFYVSIATILITLVSLFSPVGYLVSIAFSCCLIMTRGNKRNRKKYFCAMFFVLFMVSFLFKIFLGVSIWDIVDDSLLKVINRGGSFYSRFGSIIASLQAFAEKPFFGWGYSGTFTTVVEQYLSQYTTHYTNTPGLVFVIYGGVLGCMFIGALWSFFKKHTSSLMICVIAFGCILVALFNESLLDSMVLWTLIMYGVKGRKLQYE